MKVLVIVLAAVLVSRDVTGVTLCAGDFDSQLQHLLHTEMLSPAEQSKLLAVIQDLQDTLRKKWPGVEVNPIGSLLDGLSMKTSDVDGVVTVPGYEVNSETAQAYLIDESISLLQRQPQLYTNVTKAVLGDQHKLFLLNFYYVPTKTKCDISFIDTHPLEISRTAGLFYSLDHRAHVTGAVIKLWFHLQRQEHSDPTKPYDHLTSLTVNSLIIFYLQQRGILPSLFSLQRGEPWPRDSSSEHEDYRTATSMYELIGGFFQYYSGFDFDEYVVSPLAGRAIQKTLFSLFSIFTPWRKPFNTNSRLCVQDMLEPQTNIISEMVEPETIEELITRIKYCAQKFREVPSDRFLLEIFRIDLMESTNEINVEKLDVCANYTVPVEV